VHQLEEIVLEQCLFVRPDDCIPADMRQFQLPIVLHLSLVIFHFLLVISQGLHINDICLRTAALGDWEGGEVEVLEVLAVVPSKTEQGTADDQRGVSSTGLRLCSFWLEGLQGVAAGLVDEDVTCVLFGAYPTRENQDFAIVDIAGVPPPFQPLTIAHQFLPAEVISCSLGEE
jgi:hypothetical protein